MKVHGEESQAHHRFLCPFNCSHNHRTILELLRHCEKEHKENLGIYKFHACTRHNDMSLLFQVYNFLNSTLLPSSNSGKSMKRNKLTLLISGKIVPIVGAEGECFIKGIYTYVCLHRYTYYKVLLCVLPGWSLPWA